MASASDNKNPTPRLETIAILRHARVVREVLAVLYRGSDAERYETAIAAAPHCRMSVANMLEASLVDTRPPDVTERYAADSTVGQLREPAQRIADRVDELMQGPQASPERAAAQSPRAPPPHSTAMMPRRGSNTWRSSDLCHRLASPSLA